jgi:hypothetical protein
MPQNDPVVWPLRDALETAKAILRAELGMIDGCIALAAYAHHIVPNWAIDPDFWVFGVVSSSTDHLPLGDVRKRWSAAALAKADVEIAAVKERNQDAVLKACENLLQRFSPGQRVITLYRPVGPEELALIAASCWKEFPPRLPDQPIFYPVTNEAYATQIARDWNVKASGAGFVTKFEVDAYFLSRYQVQQVGGSIHTEYWIPAEELTEFNANIRGLITVVAEFR